MNILLGILAVIGGYRVLLFLGRVARRAARHPQVPPFDVTEAEIAASADELYTRCQAAQNERAKRARTEVIATLAVGRVKARIRAERQGA